MNHDEMLLRTAVRTLQADAPEDAMISASAKRVAERLGIEAGSEFAMDAIENCDDVQHLLASYRAGTLSNARSVLIDAHLRDCGACFRRFRSESGTGAVDWSIPAAARSSVWRPRKLGRAFGWALAPTLALLAASFFVYKAYWQVPPGVRAEVLSTDGSVYRISDSGDGRLTPGDRLGEGEHLRTSSGAHAVLRLTDGSTVEINERSALGVGARGHNMTVSLDSGAVIVQASKRDSGHLYVKTPDCRVAVTGTVFSVDSGIKGSRVAVLQGAVHVNHAGLDTLVHAGDQMTTSDSLNTAPVAQQIAWSHDRDKYLPLLAQFSALQRQIEQIPFPQSRYSSDLLTRVPADTLLYVSIPNLGDFMNQANKIFHDQLQQSPALQQWWGHANNHNTADLDALVDKLYQMSQYLGDEIVVVGVMQADTPSFAIVADLHRSGLDDFLRNQFSASASNPGLVVLDEASLAATPVSSKTSLGKTQVGEYALIRQHEAIFSNSIATLKQMNAQLNAGASGFATGEFGQQITAAYTRGAGVILAADLHQMIGDKLTVLSTHANGPAIASKSGIEDVRYLIAEHRETNGLPENHLNLQFSGARQRVASWLAAPAPIGSLDFVTPNAAIAVALLSKDPKAIADDIMTMTESEEGGQSKDWNEAEAKLQINFRDDLAANLGGDFLLSLDGPVLPTPSWKAVIEVHDSAKLEKTLEQLTQAIRNQAQGKNAHAITIESSQIDAQRFYSVHDLTSGSTIAQYTFTDGYMIVAPNRALLIEAIRTHTTGNSLARSTAFKALLPKDDNENYSAVAYQNLSPVLTPLLSQVSGESAEAIQKLAADARPTAICAWGKDSGIEAASDSHLFGFDFLTLEALINPGKNKLGNKHADLSVRE
ncbi:FecR domain-containing protein [Acidicapsa ligni]|uniref:FecR domain-containing protein n=1 Tax=Acidicapsa ligni TaxID=542300 RepID=UPI0021E06061|nr:FecR domain-containing protein [Acidicapsa ligni]